MSLLGMSASFRMVWFFLGQGFGFFLGMEFGPLSPLTLPLAWLTITCAAALYVEMSEQSLRHERAREIERLSNQARADKKRIKELEILENKLFEDLEEEHLTCKHLRTSSLGTNQFVAKLTCKDCESLLMYKRKDTHSFAFGRFPRGNAD